MDIATLVALIALVFTLGVGILRIGRFEGNLIAVLKQLNKTLEDHEKRIRHLEHKKD